MDDLFGFSFLLTGNKTLQSYSTRLTRTILEVVDFSQACLESFYLKQIFLKKKN